MKVVVRDDAAEQVVNAAAGYTVEIPWHNKEERELTPAVISKLQVELGEDGSQWSASLSRSVTG